MNFDSSAINFSMVAPNFEDVWSQIEPDLGDDIHPYIHQYGFGIIGRSLVRLEEAQLDQDRDIWAKQWAIKLSQDDPQAWQYNMDRKLCLKFLYGIIDKDLLLAFESFRVEKIVRHCLPMDRANALYNKIDHRSNKRGLYWFAEADREWMKSLLGGEPTKIGRLRKSRAPLNDHLRGLLDVQGLGFQNDPEISRWMTPQEPGQEDKL